MILKLYGHLFSSYTWKALIALYANDTAFEFRPLGGQDAADDAFVAKASPQGKFPVLVDGESVVFEATSIIEHLHLHHSGPVPLLPADPDEAARARMFDRVFDNYVMAIMQESVGEAIRLGALSTETRTSVEARLDRSYAWIETWLERYQPGSAISLIECAAAPSLFYADWVYQISDKYPRLKSWRAHLLALPAVKRCVDDARPFRHFFPLGAPDRD